MTEPGGGLPGRYIAVIGGSSGTMSEIALAVRTGVPVVRMTGWDLPQGSGIEVDEAGAAVSAAVSMLQTRAVEQDHRSLRDRRRGLVIESTTGTGVSNAD